MQAGKLRHRLTIQAPTQVKDGDGTPRNTFATTATIWGSVVPTQGQERFSEGNVNGDITHEITVRANAATITRRTKIIHDSRTFNVVSVADASERGILLKILAKEELA